MTRNKFRDIFSTISYGIGSIPYGTTGAIMGFYFNIFLLDNVKMDPLLIAVIIFGGRVWDAVTDPVAGYFLAFTPWTCLGRYKLWILIGFLPMSVFYFLIWQNFSFSTDASNFIYFFIIYILFQTSTTIYHLPFTTLVLYISDNLQVRDLATVVRMIFEVIGVFLGVSSHTLFLASFQNKTNYCDSSTSSKIPYDFSQEQNGYFWSALFNSFMILLSVVILLVCTKESKPVFSSRYSKGKFRIQMRKIVSALTFKPYYILLLVYMFSWLALQILQSNYAIFAKHVLMMTDNYIYMLGLMVFSMIISMFPWQILMYYFGKKIILIIGSLIVLFTLLIVLLVLDQSTLLLNYLVSIFSGVGVATFYLVPWSMLPDVTDAALLDIGIRMEELFLVFFVFFSKFGGGFALGISTLALKIFGYDSDRCIQTHRVQIGIRLLLTTLPFILICFAQICLVFYPIGEVTRKMNHEKLEEKIKVKTEDSENSDPLLRSDRIYDYKSISNIFIETNK